MRIRPRNGAGSGALVRIFPLNCAGSRDSPLIRPLNVGIGTLHFGDVSSSRVLNRIQMF